MDTNQGTIQITSQCCAGGAVARMNRRSRVTTQKGKQRGFGVGARASQARDQR